MNSKSKDIIRRVFKEKRDAFFNSHQSMFTDSFYSKYCLSIFTIMKSIAEQHMILPTASNLTVSGFFPIKSEINCMKILKGLKQYDPTIKMSLPITPKKGRVMSFREFDEKTELVPGKFKVPVPP
mmetsp:Transcript_23420/g.20359  ORF Transcript_23420/g.20359 Transcript_23420/m.20359 type:complete len:125 (-) Transcript_23420:1229-1603(-)|eukprot:CAMPEP_0114595912 /NCGR_PEP_ID=MMETSP0125-20121206/17830_1 /TAXON_ID=485358 ORGANISM="Aristerostoma sp., Strain ATCC 50986" /NCGR_SAMPLE_ID=MMETSP0125 /ASSEMBLY_ACC=CAM_ASM_000245 /LENGTH=124 /DNA_ID=CAMNT_0001798213 /DNA_START=67 /DNA_END=441 /DNA_ORIENTATION=+